MNLPVLHLTGSSYERGFLHGATLRSQIDKNILEWKQYVQKRHPIDGKEYLSKVLTSTQYLITARLHCPELCEEVRGIAEGSGNDFDTIFALQLIPEVWSDEPAGLCSVVGVRHESSATVLGQNMDIDQFYDGTQVILHIKDDVQGVDSCVFTAAGLLGLCGTNTKLSLCCNTVSQLCASVSGLPAAFVARSVLACENLEAAKKFLMTIPHGSGMAYTIANSMSMSYFECSANKVCEEECIYYKSYFALCHTNHPLSNTDTHGSATVSPTSLRRLKFLREKMKALLSVSPTLTEHHFMSLLSQPPICLYNSPDDTGFTFGGWIVVFGSNGEGEENESGWPRIYVSAGPPCVREWVEVGKYLK